MPAARTAPVALESAPSSIVWHLPARAHAGAFDLMAGDDGMGSCAGRAAFPLARPR